MNTVRINGQDYTSSLSDTEIAFMGNLSLPTTAQTLSGAIAEHENDISELNSNLTISEETETYNNTVDFKFEYVPKTKLLTLILNHGSATTFPTSWTSIGTLTNKPSSTVYMGVAIPAGHFIYVRIQSTGAVSIQCDVATSVWAQGSASTVLI